MLLDACVCNGSRLVWSPDETSVVYVADEKAPVSSSFWARTATAKNRGAEFEYLEVRFGLSQSLQLSLEAEYLHYLCLPCLFLGLGGANERRTGTQAVCCFLH